MTYNVQNTLVKGHGYSYNLHSKIDAERLCNTLNNYEKTITLHKNLNKQFDNIQKQLIQLNMTLQILNDEIKTLTSDINDLNSANR